MTGRERAVAFVHQLDGARADTVERFAWGSAVTSPSIPKIYDANYLFVDRWTGTLDELAAETDRILGAVGCTHRKVVFGDEALGERLAADAVGDPGWPQIERTVVMVLSRPPDRAAEPVPVVELDAETYYAFAAASIREEPYGNDEEVVAGLVELDRRMERLADVTWFGAIVDGKPVSRASLYLADGMAQVEDVATLEPYRNRGLARATVSRAILGAQRAGADPIVILADLHDWPWRLYEKLGFDRVAVEVGLLRPAPG